MKREQQSTGRHRSDGRLTEFAKEKRATTAGKSGPTAGGRALPTAGKNFTREDGCGKAQDPRSWTTTTTAPKAKADGTVVLQVMEEMRNMEVPESFVFGTARQVRGEEHRQCDPVQVQA